MKPIRLAVVGAGHLGRIHARLVTTLDDVRLIGIVDPLASARETVSAECHAPAVQHYDQLAQPVDAAIVATPTRDHFRVALDLLEQGVHLLVEKPICVTTEQADQLIRTAQQRQLVLQVGHVERFNPAFESARPYLTRPRYIEAIRTGGFTFRSTDIGVVLDLMIHDLDLILSLVDSQVVSVHALGIALLGDHDDMAQARLEFQNGCVANLSASRTSFTSQRRMQVFCDESYAAIDFAQRSIQLIRPPHQILRRTLHLKELSPTEREDFCRELFQRWLPLENPKPRQSNALREELCDFVRCIRTGQSPRVSGTQGRAALDVAHRILDQIERHRWNGTDNGPAGAQVLLPLTDQPNEHWQESSEHTRPLRKAG